jgi:hypothetical protein
MLDVASTSAAHTGSATAAVIKTKLVVARLFVIVRINFPPASVAASPAGRAKEASPSW